MTKQKSPIEQIVQEQPRKPRNILFVCMANINRSKTGEKVFKEMLKKRCYSVFDHNDKKTYSNYEVSVSSAGTEVDTEEANELDGGLADAADIIFTFDKGLEYRLVHRFFQPKEKIVNLDIPDCYNINNKKDEKSLKRLLRKKLSIYIPLP